MKKIKKIMIISLAFLIISSSLVFASQQGIYQMIIDRLMGLRNTYTQKDSQLVEDGQKAQEELKRYTNELEAEFIKELDAYEGEQLEEAKKVLKSNVDDVKKMVDSEKEKVLKEIKEKIKDKISKDLEKELKELEKALQKNN